MRIQRLLAGSLLALPLLMSARPASPELMTVANPDGTELRVRLFGDEHFNYATDESGKILLERGRDGILRQAERNGRKLKAIDQDIELLRSEKLAMTPQLREGQHRMAALDNQGRSTYQTHGEVNALVILLEYSDTKFCTEDPQKTFDKLCNEEGYSDYRGKGSARDYYIASSNGLFRPHFDVVGPVKLQHPSRWYTGADEPDLPNSGQTAHFGVAIQEALKALDASIDFSKYDLDGDGLIDNIFFFYSGRGQADTANNDYIWPHQADFRRYTNIYANTIGLDRLFVDGVEMATYACSNELNSSGKIPQEEQPFVDGIGAFVHEYGHVLGLPDLYDTRNTGCKAPGDYDVMDHGSYNDTSTCPPLFSAWEKWVCKWLEFTDAEEGKSYDIKALSAGDQASAVRIRLRQPGGGVRYYKEYYVLETRNNESWDKSLELNGMLLWHINYDNTLWVTNNVNTGRRPNVEIIECDLDNNVITWGSDEFAPNFLIPDSPNAPVSYQTTKKVNMWLTDIKYDPETKSTHVSYNVLKDYPDITTVMHDNPTREPGKRQVNLSWDPVEGATDYQITVKYMSVTGNELVYQGFDNVAVGNVTSYTLYNIPQAQWNQEFKVCVRVVKSLPAKNTSNVISFIPANLSEGSGVDGITDDAPLNVIGGKGEIFAPEGACAFNLNGVETGLQNLPAGLYIVSLNGRSVKVMVK